jgi:pimeloyl-ACP methyl ester carboxylesterase
MFLDNIITISNGRKLGYAEYGDANGYPVFFFHGQPGNRLFRYPDDSQTTSLGARLITIDRPGYGLSDYQPNRRLVDWPEDISELADALSIDRFAVLGFSAGGPYALACAFRIPQRLTRVGIIDSASPMYLSEINRAAPPLLRINYWLARYSPSVIFVWFRLFWWLSRRNPTAFIKMSIDQSAQSDREILVQPEVYAMLDQVWKENIRINCRGYVEDIKILMKNWGFKLSDIRKDIYIWQGEADANIPVAWAKFIASELSHCIAVFYPNEAHFAVFIHWKEIIQTLMNTAANRNPIISTCDGKTDKTQNHF